MFVCSDSHFCAERRAAGHEGPMAGHQLAALDKETKQGEPA
jgi:alpha-D-ribose 1-methylphosphonate 5-phosphate C-P lyase